MNISFGTVTGVDVGHEALRVAELRLLFGSFELVSFQEAPYLTSDDGELLIAETLKSIFQENKLSRKRVVASLPGNMVTFRVVTFPFTDKKKIDSVVRFEVENLLPFDPEEIVSDYVVLGHNEADTSVLCAVTQKSQVDRLLTTFHRAGLDPEAVDVDLFGFFNTARVMLEGLQGAFMALNIDSRVASITVLENGQLRFVKAVEVDFEHPATQEGVISQSEVFAEGEKLSYRNLKKMKELLVELKRVLRFVEAENIRVEGIYCSGQIIDGFCEALSAEFGIDSVHWTPLEAPGFQKGSVLVKGDLQSAGAAIGLSLRALNSPFLGVDFRKNSFPVKNFFYGISENLKTSFGLAGFLLALLTLSLFFKQMTYQNRFQELKSEGRRIFKQALPEVKRVVNEVAQLSEKIGTLKRDNKILGTMGGVAGSPIRFLREITLRFPESGKGDIYRFSYGKDDIRMEGRADSLKAVDSIKRELSRIDGIKRIQVTNTKLSADKKSIDYKIVLPFKSSRG